MGNFFTAPRIAQQSPQQLHIPPGFWAVAGWVTSPASCAFLKYVNRFFNFYHSSEVIFYIKPCHGAEHNTCFDGFIATFVNDFMRFPAETFGDGDSIIFLNDRDGVIERSHVMFRNNGLLYRYGAGGKDLQPPLWTH